MSSKATWGGELGARVERYCHWKVGRKEGLPTKTSIYDCGWKDERRSGGPKKLKGISLRKGEGGPMFGRNWAVSCTKIS